MLKYYKKLHIFRNSTGTNIFDVGRMLATSFNWWQYYKVIKGVKIFNNYRYSYSTSKHQRDFLELIEYDILVAPNLIIESPKGLQDLQSAVDYYNFKIEKLKLDISKKGSKQSKNLKRFDEIKDYRHKIQSIQSLLY